MLLDVADLGYRRGQGDQAFSVLLPRLTLERGELVALTGESGSGKSTVLELLGLVAEPRPGARFRWQAGEGPSIDVAALWRAGAQGGLARLRAAGIGFVMQTGGLLPYLTVRENLLVNRRLLGRPLADSVIESLIADLEIGHLLDKRPAQLSIGQQQRVSIGRALAHRPALLLADEPSSALDPRLADKVLALLLELAEGLGTAVVIATHEQERVRELGLREIRAMPWEGDTGYGSLFE